MEISIPKGERTGPVFERIAGVNALTVPEILDNILDSATPSTLASAARVSRAWSTIALSKLWSECKVIDLLRILPLKLKPQTGTRRWKLQQTPTDDDWTRFQSYASRVRSLSTARHGGRAALDKAATKWRVENETLFPRLRRVEWYHEIPISRLPSFITPRLRELYLDLYTGYLNTREEAPLVISNIAAINGLKFEKLKLLLMGPPRPANLESALANMVIASKDSIRTLQLPNSHPGLSFIAGHSFLNLTALSTRILRINGAEGLERMHALTEGCPHVQNLRIRLEGPGSNLFDSPGLRLILSWDLLSFEIWLLDGGCVSKGDLAEMGKAWPKLKKLRLSWVTHRSNEYFPLSCLADIGTAFPELEDLSTPLSYRPNDEPLLRTGQVISSSARCPLPRLQKFRFGGFPLPENQDQQDSIARFLADISPPGLRIARTPYGPPIAMLPDQARDMRKAAGRDVDPEWDSVFQKIEEIHNGVRIWVGTMPEDGGGVWF